MSHDHLCFTLLQPLIDIVCIPDLHIFRKGWIGQYVDHACFVHSFNSNFFDEVIRLYHTYWIEVLSIYRFLLHL